MSRIHEPKRLYLLRHGHTFDPEPESPVPKKAQLTEKGKQQAQETAQFLNESIRFDAIFCSGYQRTYDTAEPLAKLQNLTIKRIFELNEMPMNVSEPPTYQEIIDAYIRLSKDLEARPYDEIELVKGISFNDIYQGYLSAIQQILAHDGQHLAVFAHGGANIVMLCHFLGLPMHKLMSLYQDNCTINIIDCFSSEKFIVRQINHTCWDPLKRNASLGIK